MKTKRFGWAVFAVVTFFLVLQVSFAMGAEDAKYNAGPVSSLSGYEVTINTDELKTFKPTLVFAENKELVHCFVGYLKVYGDAVEIFCGRMGLGGKIVFGRYYGKSGGSIDFTRYGTYDFNGWQ